MWESINNQRTKIFFCVKTISSTYINENKTNGIMSGNSYSHNMEIPKQSSCYGKKWFEINYIHSMKKHTILLKNGIWLKFFFGNWSNCNKLKYLKKKKLEKRFISKNEILQNK